MTMTPRSIPMKRLAKTVAAGLVALGVSMAVLPTAASAHEGREGPRAIAAEIDRVAYEVREIADMRNPYRQDARIDRLQQRLARLEAITEHQRGRLARQNDLRIDRLQARLHRMEYRAERRIDRREDRWSDGRGGYRDYRPDGAVISFGWRY